MNIPLTISYVSFVLFGSFVTYLFLLWLLAMAMKIRKASASIRRSHVRNFHGMGRDITDGP